MSWILDRLLALLTRYLPSSAVPSRKVAAAGVVGPLVPILISLLKRAFPVLPTWLDFLLNLVAGSAPIAAAYVVPSKALTTKPGTTRVV